MRHTIKQSEAEVLRISKTLAGPTEKQKEWMNDASIEHKIFRNSKHKCWCSHCGAEFSAPVGLTAVCPICGGQYQVVLSRKATFGEHGYSAIITTRKGWQIIRYFLTECHTYCESNDSADYAQSYSNIEIMRKWYNPTYGHKVTERISLGSFVNWRKIPYRIHEPDKSLKITRREWAGSAYGDNFNSEWFKKVVYSSASVLPFFKQRGLNVESARKIAIDKYCEFVMADKEPLAETCVKHGQFLVANHILYNSGTWCRQKDHIKIALRHGYKFYEQMDSLRDYDDYIGQLEQLRMDTHNPVYLCPDNFAEAHHRLTERIRIKREEEERIENEKQMLRDKKDIAEFSERIQRYAALVMVSKVGIEIKPLMSIKEFQEEGKAMHHCVFANRYYARKDCLILSAKIDGQRVETIEVNLNTYKVEQSRGVCNKPTEYHKEILSLVNKNMGTIREMHNAS